MRMYAATDSHYLLYIAQNLVNEAPKSALKSAWDEADVHCQRLFKNAPTIASAKSIIKSKFDPDTDMPEVNIYF
jgi:ribonuclease D